jgi:hypothetical protein
MVIRPAPPTRSRLRDATLLGLALSLLNACSGGNQVTGGGFWREAFPDPVVTLSPDPGLPQPGAPGGFDVLAAVVDHRIAFAANSVYHLDLEVMPGNQPISLEYRLAPRQRIPVKPGDAVRLALPTRQIEGRVARGLLLWVIDTSTAEQATRLVAVIDDTGAVPPGLLPAALANVQPTDTLVYQTSHKVGGECYVSVTHQQFAVGAEPVAGAPDTRQLLPPGSHVEPRAGREVWDLWLTDNRQTLTTSCPPTPAPYWAWSALRLPDLPAAPQPAAAPKPDGAPGEPRTAPGAPRGKFPPRPRRL